MAKTKINKKDMQLEKQIMQQQECTFIVKLYYALSDQYYVYLLMVCLNMQLTFCNELHCKGALSRR